MHRTTLNIPVKSPYRLDYTVWVLRRRDKNIVDRWQGATYNRILTLDDKPMAVSVSLVGQPADNSPSLELAIESETAITGTQKVSVEQIMRKVLGVDTDISDFYAIAARYPKLDALAYPFLGVRPPRYPSLFEALVNAVSCQQVSLEVGIMLINRISEKFGQRYVQDSSELYAFPRPEDIFDLPDGELKSLGYSWQKERTIKTIAYGVVNDELRLGNLEAESNEVVMKYLQGIKGIGRWSAEYVLLRGLGRLEVFPGDDVGGQNNIQELLGLDTRPDYDKLLSLSTGWNPYGGLVYFHLLLDKLRRKGVI